MQTTRKWILSICSNTLQHTSRDIEQVSPCVHTTGKTCWGLNIPKPQLHMKYPTRLYHYRPTSSRTANCFCRFAVATLSALTIPSTPHIPARALQKTCTSECKPIIAHAHSCVKWFISLLLMRQSHIARLCFLPYKKPTNPGYCFPVFVGFC